MRENGISGNLAASDAGQAEADVRIDFQKTHCCLQSPGGDRTCKTSRMEVIIACDEVAGRGARGKKS